MRMQENFTGCRVVAYCLLCNHVHLLLEEPSLAEGGLSDEELLLRMKAVPLGFYGLAGMVRIRLGLPGKRCPKR
jgi:hypothetical protein